MGDERRGYRVAGVVLLGLVVFGGLWLWSRGEREGAVAAGREAAAVEGDAGTAEAEGRGDASAGERAEAPGVDASVPSAGRALQPIALTAPVVAEDEDAGAGMLVGTVVGWASARPVAGAELSFAHGGATRSVHTDGEGEFVLAPEQPGTYELALVTADGFLPFAPEWGHSPIRFEARPGVRVEGVRIVLVDAIEYVVEVVDAEGEPVAGAEVRVFGVDRGERAMAPMRSTYATDAAGEARVSAPDGAVLEASHPDRGTGRAAIDSAAQVSHRVRVALRREVPEELAGDHTIAGRVIDPDDAPVEGALIVARRHVSPGSARAALHPELGATTGPDGRFVLRGADAGSYRLTASADGFARRVEERVPAGAEDVTLRLAREGRVRVRAVDGGSGEPVAALTVVVERPRGALATETLAVESAYDAEGELEVGGLPVGPVRVVVSSPGYAPSDPADARAVTEEPSVVEARLSRGGTIRGRVVSSGGETPLAGARVSLEGRLGSGSSAVPLHVSALTETDGSFELTGAPAGVRSIVAWAADHHGRVRSGLAVRAGEVTDVGVLDLTPVEEGETPQLELAGIGAVLSAEDDAMVIGRVIEGGGAAEVGLGPGDAILGIDGVPAGRLGFGGSIERIRGPEGTTVRLRVRRAESERVEEIEVPRRRIRA